MIGVPAARVEPAGPGQDTAVLVRVTKFPAKVTQVDAMPGSNPNAQSAAADRVLVGV